jgi:hypothetical protein
MEGEKVSMLTLLLMIMTDSSFRSELSSKIFLTLVTTCVFKIETLEIHKWD